MVAYSQLIVRWQTSVVDFPSNHNLMMAENIEHFVSCVNEPYKGASTIMQGSIVRIFKARRREDVKVENRQPGKIIFFENNSQVVVCGSGLLTLLDVRNELGLSILPLKYFCSRFC